MYTSKAIECPFQDFSADDKEDKSGKIDQRSFLRAEDGKRRSKRKLQNQIRIPYVNDAYANGEEDPITDDDPPVQSFLSLVEIKEEPPDINSSGGNGNGAHPTSLDDTLSSSESSSFSSSSCPVYPDYESKTALDLLYDSMNVDPVVQIKLSEAAAAQRARRRRHLERMTEEERQAKRARAAAQQRKKRQQLLECMTEEQRRTYRAAIAEAQRIRRHIRLQRMSEEEKRRQRSIESALSAKRRRLRQEKMTEEERRAYRAAAAAAQRRKRLLQKERMTNEELQEFRAAEAARRRRLRQEANTPEESSSEHRPAAVRRVSRPRHKEKWMEEEQLVQYAAASAQKDLYHYGKDVTSNVPHASAGEGETTPEDLMMQILMQAQHAAALQYTEGQDQGVKAESVGACYSQQDRLQHYSQQNRMVEQQHHLNTCMTNQPYKEMPQHEGKNFFY